MNRVSDVIVAFVSDLPIDGFLFRRIIKVYAERSGADPDPVSVLLGWYRCIRKRGSEIQMASAIVMSFGIWL